MKTTMGSGDVGDSAPLRMKKKRGVMAKPAKTPKSLKTPPKRPLSDLMNIKGGMVKGNVTKGGPKFGPSSGAANSPFSGNYGGGMQNGLNPGYLGPFAPGSPTKKGTK